MLESNMFRISMLVAGVMVVALIISLVFTVNLIDLDNNEDGNMAPEAARFESIMERELDENQTKITVYDAVWFSVKGLIRGNVQHY